MTDTQTEPDREIDIETDRKTDRRTESKIERHAERQADKEISRCKDTQLHIHIDCYIDLYTYRQACTWRRRVGTDDDEAHKTTASPFSFRLISFLRPFIHCCLLPPSIRPFTRASIPQRYCRRPLAGHSLRSIRYRSVTGKEWWANGITVDRGK